MEVNTLTLEEKCSFWVEECRVQTNPKTKKDELRAEARDFFRSALSVPANYSDPRSESLAKLIQSLGPGLTASLPSRICALSVLCGATEGCHNQRTALTIKTANLIISFLIEQCGPIRDDDNNNGVDDYDEQVRDAALETLSALIKCQFRRANDDVKQATEAFQLCCKVAREGIERRCALPEEESTHMDHGFAVTSLNDVRGGLSTLPRSRRSRCFSLLQSAVESMGNIITSKENKALCNLGVSVENDVVEFVVFACNCLQGESDPRCLMQLLALLHQMQVTFQPVFREGQLASFPITKLFDAVAPYYPINFIPPPHDNHGITQKGLRDALMAVLSYFGYDELAANKKKDTMLSLSLGIVLERLIPMGGDGESLAESAVEKEEAVDDLLPILFPADDSTFDRLDKGSIQQLSAALIMVHQQASVAVSQGGNVENDKRLADTCRTLISRIALRLEGPEHKTLWKVFVQDPVASMATRLTSASTEGRIAIAYLACLAASGGPQTLRCALETGLAPLITAINDGLQDEEKVTAAAYGIGAFFSSCNVAMEKAGKSGLVLHPHPLEKFSSDAFEELYNVFANSTNNNSTSLRVASVRALESVLIVSPSSHFKGTEPEKITQFVNGLAACVLEASTPDTSSNDDTEFIEASTESLGILLGKCMENVDDNLADNACILTSELVRDELKGKIFIDVLYKAEQETEGTGHLRYDRSLLAKACSLNFSAATSVVESLVDALKDRLQQHSLGRQSMECARALSYVLRNGGVVAARAFHELSQHSVAAHGIFDMLSEINTRKVKTSLDLPAAQQESETLRQLTQEFVSLLIPAYEKWVPRTAVFRLVASVSKILPPLSDKDAVELSITLPLLSASLESCEPLQTEEKDTCYDTMVEQLNSAISDFAAYSLNLDYDPRSRSSAAACLHAYIVDFAPREKDRCPAQSLLEKVIMPSFVNALDNTSGKKTSPKDADTSRKAFFDCMNLAAVLGSAAARRGGISSSTADKVASFFVELACERKSTVPYTQDSFFELDLLAYDDEVSSKTFSFVMGAVAAFGTMLSIQDRRPIWKQRLTHNTFKYVEPILKRIEQSGAKLSIESLGSVAVVCHLICSGSYQSTSLSTKGMAVRILVRSLASGPFYEENSLKQPGIANDLVVVKKLVIASILKLSCSSPGLLSSYIESIITGLMRAYAVTADSDPLTDITCKLLTLQVFERICHLEVGRKTLLAVRPAVVSILGAAMNHPSRMLREAAVAVRNTWFTLE